MYVQHSVESTTKERRDFDLSEPKVLFESDYGMVA